MTTEELEAHIHQYRAGLEAEMTLLYELKRLADEQRKASVVSDLDRLGDVIDERDRVMVNLVTLEHELRPVRQTLAEWKDLAQGISGFAEVTRLHRNAADLVFAIGTTDKETMSALKDAELARRLASHAIEIGETTLAAYRRVIAPPVSSATLIDSRG